MKYSSSSRRQLRHWFFRLTSLILCSAFLSPCFAIAASGGTPGTSQDLSPTSGTSADGKRQITPGPYVPAALRTDNGERRANGRTGKQVAPLAAKLTAPASNLPNLTESRKTRVSPITATSSTATSGSASAAQVTDSAAFQQIDVAC